MIVNGELNRFERSLKSIMSIRACFISESDVRRKAKKESSKGKRFQWKIAGLDSLKRLGKKESERNG